MNSEIKTYRFILTPLDKVFFGGEKSPFKQEYFQVSRKMPQQTSVLGFLRYEALVRSGYINKPRDLWPDLIGKYSFNGSFDQLFGIIKKISPVSIRDKISNRDLFIMRNPNMLNPVNVPDLKINFGENTIQNKGLYFFEKIDKKGKVQRFDPKNHIYFGDILTDFIDKTMNAECTYDESVQLNHGLKLPKQGSGVFYPDIRPGITKNYNGNPDDEGYYKTLFWKMMPGFAYSFLAQISPSSEIKDWEGTSIVRFGGDSSLFNLKIESASWPTEFGEGDVFVLQSDALVCNKIYDFCKIIISDTVPFRNLKTTYKDIRFTKRPVLKWYNYPGEDTRNTDPLKMLLRKGSILMAKENFSDQLKAELTNDPFLNIGYNHYKRFKNFPTGL